ncbi:MAG: DUF1554 domain-containing protein [Gammaproteobacteria bacterium]|nr:DUF1554 domain-containing protein [Gammaproteobacteria bacterium]
MRTWTTVFLILLADIPITTLHANNIFNVTLTGGTFTIAPVYNPIAPNKPYPNAGVKISSPRFTLSHCTPQPNQFCTFPVSTNAPASLAISGPSGPITLTACLNGTKKTANCEEHVITIPAIIFITQTGYSGDLNGTTGADALCNNEAYGAGSQVPPGRTFKALLVSSTRYPCSNPNGNTVGGCLGIFQKDWPLVPNTVYYQPNGATVFNTVNENGVFDDEVVTLQDVQGNASVAQFWSGVQSVHSTPDGFHIDAWAFDDMNPDADQISYRTSLADCQNWSSSHAGINGNVGSAARIDGGLRSPVPVAQWGNYYNFQDNDRSYLFNLFNISAYYTCDGPASLVCVG